MCCARLPAASPKLTATGKKGRYHTTKLTKLGVRSKLNKNKPADVDILRVTPGRTAHLQQKTADKRRVNGDKTTVFRGCVPSGFLVFGAWFPFPCKYSQPFGWNSSCSTPENSPRWLLLLEAAEYNELVRRICVTPNGYARLVRLWLPPRRPGWNKSFCVSSRPAYVRASGLRVCDSRCRLHLSLLDWKGQPRHRDRLSPEHGRRRGLHGSSLGFPGPLCRHVLSSEVRAR